MTNRTTTVAPKLDLARIHQHVRPGKPIVIVITTDKGGSGKTTTAINLANELAKGDELTRGEPTLLGDLDPRGDCATSLGMNPEPGILNFTISRQPARACIRQTPYPNLDLLPSDNTTEGVLAFLEKVPAQVTATTQTFVNLFAEQRYTWIVVDAPPNAGALRRILCELADIVIIPCKTELLGLEEVDALMQALPERSAKVILPVMHLPELANRAVLERMAGWWPDNLVPLQAGTDATLEQQWLNVPSMAVVRQASLMRQPLGQYAPNDRPTLAYAALASAIRFIAG